MKSADGKKKIYDNNDGTIFKQCILLNFFNCILRVLFKLNAEINDTMELNIQPN